MHNKRKINAQQTQTETVRKRSLAKLMSTQKIILLKIHSNLTEVTVMNTHTNPQPTRSLPLNLSHLFNNGEHTMNTPKKTTLKMKLAILLIGATLLFALGQTRPAHAATEFHVGVGGCTLNGAVASANNDGYNYNNGCGVGSGADTIILETDVVLTWITNSITSVIILEGNGHTIDGNGHGVFNVGVNGNLTLNNVTITGGTGLVGNGGAIRNSGTVTVNNSTLTDNQATNGGGIWNQGTLTLNYSTISGNSASSNGGGIYYTTGASSSGVYLNHSLISGNSAPTGGGIWSSRTLTVDNSTLSGNSATNGGGIYNLGGTVTINTTTISDNVGSTNGGGIYNYTSNSCCVATVTINTSTLNGNSATDSGGGIYNYASCGYCVATVTVNNSTLSGNSAANLGGGIYNIRTSSGTGSATVTLNSSTLSGNSATNSGGGIYNTITSTGSATVALNRSLIAGNSASNGAEVYRNSGTINANNYNLFGHNGLTNAQAFVSFTPGGNDRTATSDGTISTALAAILDALASNGGPTLTHALVSGSPAIDFAPNAGCTAAPINGLDQRGSSRPMDGNGTPSDYDCDAGAFEVQ
jgi:hypothetical protein